MAKKIGEYARQHPLRRVFIVIGAGHLEDIIKLVEKII